MINRIRDVRKAKGWTLAQLAQACEPTTTAQTVGRLETGTRTLSTKWLQRIADALGVEPETLVRSDKAQSPRIVALLAADGAQALTTPAEAVLPVDLGGDGALMVLSVESPAGEYRAGDQLWLRQRSVDDTANAINRDVLVPRPGGRFAFGRLIDRQGTLVGILPPGAGQKQQVVDSPPWIAVAAMLVRGL